MLVQEFTNNSAMSKHYYIKRKLIKDQALIYNGSIFPSSNNHETSELIYNDSLKQFQTITTNIDQTVTFNGNNDADSQILDRKKSAERSQILPRIYSRSQTKHSKQSIQDQKILPRPFKPKSRIKTQNNNHNSDPLYLKLERTIAKRINVNFNRYKKGWIDSSLRRKGKSVIQRSLEKASSTIDHINTDSTKRRTNTQWTQMLRNNNQQRKFSFPAKMRLDIEGLQGRGGKVTSLIPQKYILEQVYMHDKSQ